jgi:hypothetical protein
MALHWCSHAQRVWNGFLNGCDYGRKGMCHDQRIIYKKFPGIWMVEGYYGKWRNVEKAITKSPLPLSRSARVRASAIVAALQSRPS